MRETKRVKELLDNVSMFGPSSTFKWLIIRAIKKVIKFDILVLTERALTDPVKEINPKVDVVHKLISADQMDDLIERFEFIREGRFADLDKVYKEMRGRFKDDQIACISLVDNKIVSCKWIDFKRIKMTEIEEEIKLPDKSAYFCDSYTVPSYRGNRIQPASSEFLFNIFKSQGIDKFFGYVSCDNMPSLASLKSSGWKKKGYIYSVILFKKRRNLFSNNVKNFIDAEKLKLPKESQNN